MIDKTRSSRKRAPAELMPCETCRTRLTPSGSMCNPCRVRKNRGALIDGERCAVPSCGIALPRVLRWQRFGGETVALCANHAALVGRREIGFEAFIAEASEHERELTPLPPEVRLRKVESSVPPPVRALKAG